MIIKYNFTEVDTVSLDLLAELQRGNRELYHKYADLFRMESISNQGDQWIAYRRNSKVLLLESVESEEVVTREINKQCMLVVLKKISGITTDKESIELAFSIAESLGIEVSAFNFEAHKEETLAIYFDSLNEIYYAQ